MIRSAAIVLLLLLAGDAIAEGYDLPVPGAALGLAALTAAFAIRGGPDRGSGELFDFAAPYFPLFFVPAAVGVMANSGMLASAWTYILVAVVAGTSATLLITGIVFQFLMRRIAQAAEA